jgi:hypothetical protein
MMTSVLHLLERTKTNATRKEEEVVETGDSSSARGAHGQKCLQIGLQWKTVRQLGAFS